MSDCSAARRPRDCTMSSSPPAKTRAATVSIASNSFLITIKVAAGLLTGSVGILSDAIHSLMDLFGDAPSVSNASGTG